MAGVGKVSRSLLKFKLVMEEAIRGSVSLMTRYWNCVLELYPVLFAVIFSHIFLCAVHYKYKLKTDQSNYLSMCEYCVRKDATGLTRHS
jgi:hypothetical protein